MSPGYEVLQKGETERVWRMVGQLQEGNVVTRERSYDRADPERRIGNPLEQGLSDDGIFVSFNHRYGIRNQEPAETDCGGLQTASSGKIPGQAGVGRRIYRGDRGQP